MIMGANDMDMQDMQRTVQALVGLLEEWARWSGGYRPRIGYPSHAAGFFGGGSSSFDDLCDAMDAQTCRAVDAAISDLPPIQQSAILKRYGVAAVFRFRDGVYERALCDAHEALIPVLRKKGVFYA